MSDISAFPTMTDILVGDSGPIHNLIAGGTIKAGMVVGYAAGASTSRTVVAMTATRYQRPVGVALHDATSGDRISVAGPGCEVKVANADDTDTIAPGSYVQADDNAVGGTVKAATDSSNEQRFVIGYLLDSVAGDGTGVIVIQPMMLGSLA